MSDFDTTQDELSDFLDKQFQQEEPVQQNQPQPEEDDNIDEYLGTYEEITNEPSPVVENQTPQQQAPAQQTEDDRILQLERELAATKARSQMFENALTSQYTSRYQQEDEQQRPDLVFQDDELKVDERLLSDYSDADPYITAVAKRVANDMYSRVVQPLRHELANVQNALQQQQQFNENQSRGSMYMQLKAAVPELDELSRSAEWQSYIQQPDIYGGTRTIASYVQDGIQSGNVRQVVAIIDNFKKAKQQSQPKQGNVAPGRAQQSTPATKPGSAKKYRYADFERATADFQAGKLSWDKYQRIVDVYNDAALEGRVY